MSMKMKLASIALLGATITSGAVFADCDPSFYVGAEAQFNKFNKKTNIDRIFTLGNQNPLRKNSATGGGIFVGSRLHENFGVEVGASLSRAIKGSWDQTVNGIRNRGNATVRTNNIFVDAMGYLPVTNEVDLIGSLGVGVLTSRISSNNIQTQPLVITNSKLTARSTKAGVRAGVGVQYKFDENIGARLMARFQQGNHVVKSNTQLGLGLFYQF